MYEKFYDIHMDSKTSALYMQWHSELNLSENEI